MTPTTRQERSYDVLDVSALSFWAKTADEREETFEVLRRERPVSWHRPIEGSLAPSTKDGIWVVTTHDLISFVSKNPELFCSGDGVQFEEAPAHLNEAIASFLSMDAPRHGALRRLVSSAFTPKQVAKIDDQIKQQASTIVDDLLVAREGDFVSQVSKRLPMWTIYEMMGLEDTDKRLEAAHHADGVVAWADDEVADGRAPAQVLEDSLLGLHAIAYEFINERRAHPKADLMTNLVQAEVDGQRLTDAEIASFFALLSIAGNDTTRNTISIAARALQDNPDQKALLVADFDGRIPAAIEEFVRFASPVMTFRRTATRDVTLGGRDVKEGDWVAMIYSSGNRDEAVFEHPGRFDIARNPNPHVGFGGGGPHFCMGNFVAKKQLREIFFQLLHRVPGLELGEPEYLTGNFVRAVKRLPYVIR